MVMDDMESELVMSMRSYNPMVSGWFIRVVVVKEVGYMRVPLSRSKVKLGVEVLVGDSSTRRIHYSLLKMLQEV